MISDNIAFLRSFNPKLADSISAVKESVSLPENKNTFLEKEYDLEIDGKTIHQELIATSTSALKYQLDKPKRILMQRLCCSDIQALSHGEIYASIIDSDKVQSLQHLRSLRSNDEEGKSILFSGTEMPPNIILVGSISLVTILDLIKHNPHVSSLLLVESNIHLLCAAMKIVDLRNIIEEFRSKKIKFDLKYDPNLATDSASMSLILSHYASNNPLALHSLAIIRSSVYDSSYELIFSWLESTDGFLELVKGYLGNETDEINQVLHTVSSELSSKSQFKLLGPDKHPHENCVILTASGPSLDDQLELLSSFQDIAPICCAGSSLGSLLRSGIQPAAVTLLEMSSIVYHDLLDLLVEGYQLDKIDAFVSATVDPRIHGMFKSSTVFHRPLSSASCLFPSAVSSVLPQAGPQVVNAAFEVLVNLGFRNIFLFGCDFGGPSTISRRSKHAMGLSNRTFDFPVPGSFGKTVMSSSELSVSRQLFENAASLYNVKLTSFGEGSKIEGALNVMPGCEEKELNKCNLWQRNVFDELILSCQSRFVSGSEVLEIASAASEYVASLVAEFKQLILNGNLSDLSLFIGQILSWNDNTLPMHEKLVNRIIRYPLFFIGQPLIDFEYDESNANSRTQFLSVIESDFIMICNLVLDVTDSMKSMAKLPLPDTWHSGWFKRNAIDKCKQVN